MKEHTLFSLSGHRPWIIRSGPGRYYGSSPAPSATGGNVTDSQGKHPYIHSSSSAPTTSANVSSTNATAPHKGHFSPTRVSPSKDQPDSAASSKNQQTRHGASQNQSKHGSTPSDRKSGSSYGTPQAPKRPARPSANIYSGKRLRGKSPQETYSSTVSPEKSTATYPKTSFQSAYSKYGTGFQHSSLNVHEPYKGMYSAYANSESQPLEEINEDGKVWDPSMASNYGIKTRRQLPLSTTSNDSSVIMRRDTFLIPKNSWIVIRFEANNPGIWLLSDQTQWHFAAGGAMQISSRKPEWPKIPEEIQKFCQAKETIGV